MSSTQNRETIDVLFTRFDQKTDVSFYVEQRLDPFIGSLPVEARTRVVQWYVERAPAIAEALSDAVQPLTPDESAEASGLLHRANEIAPLLDGEKRLKEDQVYKLSRPYREHEAGTLLVLRETDAASFYCIAPVSPRKPLRLHAEVVMTLAKAIGSAVLEKVGAKIYDEALKQLKISRVPSYFDEVYAQMYDVVREAIAAERIEKLNEEIQAFDVKMKDYTAVKEPRFLAAAWDAVTYLLGAATSAGYPAGMQWNIAANLHLMVLQEYWLLETDPVKKKDYAKRISALALEHANAADEKHKKLLEARLAKVGNIYWLFVLLAKGKPDWPLDNTPIKRVGDIDDTTYAGPHWVFDDSALDFRGTSQWALEYDFGKKNYERAAAKRERYLGYIRDSTMAALQPLKDSKQTFEAIHNEYKKLSS